MVLLVFWRDLSFGGKDDRLSWLICESHFSLTGVFFEEQGVIARGPDECVGLNESGESDFAFSGFFQSLDQLSHRLA